MKHIGPFNVGRHGKHHGFADLQTQLSVPRSQSDTHHPAAGIGGRLAAGARSLGEEYAYRAQARLQTLEKLGHLRGSEATVASPVNTTPWR